MFGALTGISALMALSSVSCLLADQWLFVRPALLVDRPATGGHIPRHTDQVDNLPVIARRALGGYGSENA